MIEKLELVKINMTYILIQYDIRKELRGKNDVNMGPGIWIYVNF